MSDSAPGFFGYENKEELKKVKVPDLYENAAYRKKHTKQIEEKGFTKEYLVNLKKKDGSVLNTLITSVPVKDDNGEVVAYQGTIRDITKQTKISKKLEHERVLLKALMDNSPDHIYFKDKEGRFIRVSKNHVSKFGIKSPEEAIGKTDLDFFTDEHASKAFKDEKEVLRTGEPIIAKEEKETWKDGSITWVASSKFPLFDSKNKIVGTCGIVRDITKQKDIQFKLSEHREHLRELNATKDKFFSILGHDLRSPFNSIIGFSELLTNEVDSFNKDEIKEMAESIYKTGMETYGLLNNLLEWSRSQTGNMKFNPAKIKIYDIAESAVDLLNDNAKRKNIEVSVDIPEKTTAFIDENMIKTVIRNLLSNAIKFTHEKGSIKISAKDNDDFVDITVSDTGVGMEPDDIKKLFRIDEVISTQGTSEEKGTGLGLVLCHDFVKKNNGDIRVESTVDKGSRFTVSLPVEERKK